MKIDIFNPDNYVNGTPHHMFKWLRANAPVHFHGEVNGRGYWALTRHKDIVAVSRDPATFSSARGATFIRDYADDSDELQTQRFMLPNMDPPQHIKYRNLVRPGFVPKMIHFLEPRIRQRVTEILDAVPAEGDFVHEVAGMLPIHVIAEMIGVPDEDRDKVFDWGRRLVNFDNPDALETYEDARGVAMEMFQYAGELAQQRYESPSDDLISILMHGVVDGEQLTVMEFASFFMLLVVAGHETTRNVIAGGLLSLLQHPHELARLQAHPELMPSAVEEMLRWVAPINYFRRTATRDTEIGGQRIKENDKVVLYYASANHDEDIFVDPDTFNIARKPNDHLAFGIGQHMCLGAPLARLEIRLMFEQLLARFPDIQIDGPIVRMRSNFVNGIDRLPVRYSPVVQVAVGA